MSVNVKTHDISNDSEDKEEDKTAKSEAICWVVQSSILGEISVELYNLLY